MKNEELFNDWLNALETQGWRQNKSYLGDSDSGFCCLGLLCRVTRKSYDMNDTFPPSSIAELIFNRRFESEPCDLEHELAQFNDGGTPFLAIASFLRRIQVNPNHYPQFARDLGIEVPNV